MSVEIEKHRFSIAFFLICLFEVLFWSLPVASSVLEPATIGPIDSNLASYLYLNSGVFEAADVKAAHKSFERVVLEPYIQEILNEQVR